MLELPTTGVLLIAHCVNVYAVRILLCSGTVECSSGYVQSKWVSEQLVSKAVQRDLIDGAISR